MGSEPVHCEQHSGTGHRVIGDRQRRKTCADVNHTLMLVGGADEEKACLIRISVPLFRFDRILFD